MQFAPSETERMLRDSTRRFLAGRAQGLHGRQPSSETWAEMAKLGWFGLALPESAGGLGGSARELFTILEEAGRTLAGEPLLPNLMVPGPIHRHADTSVLQAFAAGKASFAFGRFAEPGGPRDGILADALTTHYVMASGDRDGWVAALFCIPAHEVPLPTARSKLFDGSMLAGLDLPEPVGMERFRIASGAEATELAGEIEDRLAAGAAAEALGAIDRAFALTLDYLKQRTQFGQKLASLQAVQHMMAESYCSLEQCRSLVLAAGIGLDSSPGMRRRSVSAAKAYVAGRGRDVVETCIQLSGGIGVTDEYELGHLYKRVLTRAALFGDGDHHLARLAQLAREEGQAGPETATEGHGE